MKKNLNTLEMKRLFEEEGLTMEQIGARFGVIKQTVQKRLAKLGIGRRPSKHTLVDKHRLETLYSQNISIEKIAAEFNESARTIEYALLYYGIPKRPPIKSGRKHIDLIRDLAVGETREVISDAKHLRQTLYGTAQTIGIRIAVRALDGGDRFMIIRIE